KVYAASERYGHTHIAAVSAIDLLGTMRRTAISHSERRRASALLVLRARADAQARRRKRPAARRIGYAPEALCCPAPPRSFALRRGALRATVSITQRAFR